MAVPQSTGAADLALQELDVGLDVGRHDQFPPARSALSDRSAPTTKIAVAR
jgi:hypothetical protein